MATTSGESTLADNSNRKKNIPIDTDEMVSEKLAERESDDTQPDEKTDSAQIPENEDRLKALEQEAAEKHDRLLRLSADFENYKKRMNRQMDDLRKYANESLLKDLLYVVDNLERAVNTSSEKPGESIDSCVLEGVEMTLAEITKLLTRNNVTPIEALGKPFDPAYHEAVMQAESSDHPENTVINVFQKGYLIHDRLLRPAMVVVSKAKQ
jgi:molecular chaperone GrpE